MAAVESADKFGQILYAEAIRRGLSQAEQVIVIGDGARWIWNVADEHFPKATQVVDMFHALLKKLGALQCDGDLAEEVRKVIGYFETNQNRMRYGQYRRLGLFVGSGVVEPLDTAGAVCTVYLCGESSGRVLIPHDTATLRDQTVRPGYGEMKASPLGEKIQWSSIGENTSLARRIADHLAEPIIEGRLVSGTLLSESDIAQTFGVSRTPVREAFYILERDGLLERPPRKGARVARVTEKQALDVYVCRAYLYGLSARMCATRLDANDLAALARLVARMGAAVDSEHVRDYFQFNLEFHDYVGRATENEMLLKLMSGMGRLTLRFRFMSLTVPGRLRTSLEGHRRLLDDFRGHDPDGAEKRVREIISDAGDAVLSYFFGNTSEPVKEAVFKW